MNIIDPRDEDNLALVNQLAGVTGLLLAQNTWPTTMEIWQRAYESVLQQINKYRRSICSNCIEKSIVEEKIKALNTMAQRLWALGGSSFHYDHSPELQKFFSFPRINQPFTRADEMGRDSRLLSMHAFLRPSN